MQIKSALNMTIFIHHRSIRPDVFCKTGVLRNFAKFTGKHLCQSIFFDKVAGLRPEAQFCRVLRSF